MAELIALAERRHRDPAASVRRARELVAAARDPSVEATAHRVVGLALHELSRPAEAIGSFEQSIRISAELGLDDCQALAQAALAISRLILGDIVGATREIAEARAHTPETTRGVVEFLHGVVLHRTGQLDEALNTYRRALRRLRDADDRSSIAVCLQNRAILRGYQGDLEGAIEDLLESEGIARERDLPILVAMATHNLGFVLARRGDMAGALAAFERAERAYRALDNPPRYAAVLQADRGEALMLAGLASEARTAAEAAVEAIRPTGDVAYLAECRLLLARAHLAVGSYPEAVTEASMAARQFTRIKFQSWAAQARYVAVQAQVAAIEDRQTPPLSLLSRSRRIAAELASQGWPVEAAHVRTFVGRMALALGRPAVARAELALAAPARARGTADLRAQAWHATALIRLAEGNRAGAKRALTQGMTVVDAYRATLVATELRVHAAAQGAELARLGILLALGDRNAAEVLRWSERSRAVVLRNPSVRPPDDEELASAMTALRDARRQLRQAALSGTTDRGLEQRAARLEEVVRIRTMQAEGDPAVTGRVDIRAIRQTLGDRVLVEFVAVEGNLHAVTATARQVKLHSLGSTAEVAQEKQYLLFALRRCLATRPPSPAWSTLMATAARLDQLLFGRLHLPPETSVIVVPSGVLHGLPWSTLPSLSGRATTMAPSAALWLGTHRRDDPQKRAGSDDTVTTQTAVALVAGPGLRGADAEVRALAHLYDGATVLAGQEATTAGVLGALERVEVAHIAAHGIFRNDSPLFSSLLLADGPLTVYDLERLGAVPSIVVLAACSTGAAAVRTGDQLLGTAVALIGLGVRSVIAPVMAVPDGSTVDLMLALHQRLLEGEPPSAALAKAAQGLDRAAVSAFVCIGCDDAGRGRIASTGLSGVVDQS
jgi:tetratricopeptide (TPR) repeat protein